MQESLNKNEHDFNKVLGIIAAEGARHGETVSTGFDSIPVSIKGETRAPQPSFTGFTPSKLRLFPQNENKLNDCLFDTLMEIQRTALQSGYNHPKIEDSVGGRKRTGRLS